MRELIAFSIWLAMTLYFLFLTGLIGLVVDKDSTIPAWFLASVICGAEAVALMVAHGLI